MSSPLLFTAKQESELNLQKLRRASMTFNLHPPPEGLGAHTPTLTVDDLPHLPDAYDKDFQQGEMRVTSEGPGTKAEACDPRVAAFYADVRVCMRLRGKYQMALGHMPSQNPATWDTWVEYPATVAKQIRGPDQPKGAGSIAASLRQRTPPSLDSEEEEDEEEFYVKTHPTEARKKPNRFTLEGFCLAFGIPWDRATQLVTSSSTALPSHSFPPYATYLADLNHLLSTTASIYGSSIALLRLSYLRAKHTYYTINSGHLEEEQVKLIPHRDIYNVRKVTAMNVSSSLNRKALMDFIRLKVACEPNRVVCIDHGAPVTLAQLAEDPIELEQMGDLENANTSRLRETFLGYDNHLKGEYLGEIVRTQMKRLEGGYVSYEYNIELTLDDPWERLASWVCDNQLFSPHLRWVVVLPLHHYTLLRAEGRVQSYGEFLDLLFSPLLTPSLKLLAFLTKVSAIDLMLNLPLLPRVPSHTALPNSPEGGDEWRSMEYPPIYYSHYHCMQRLAAVNHHRRHSQPPMNTLSLMVTDNQGVGDCAGPSCVRAFLHLRVTANPLETFSVGYLMGARIATSGRTLADYLCLQYLCYLSQVGVLTAPTSDIRTHPKTVTYSSHPFVELLQTGLTVSINANNPLVSSLTREPVMEEYCIAGNIIKMNDVELCELMRNSVRNSGWGMRERREGGKPQKPTAPLEEGNVRGDEIAGKPESIEPSVSEPLSEGWLAEANAGFRKTNVPPMRVRHRVETLRREQEFVGEQADSLAFGLQEGTR